MKVIYKNSALLILLTDLSVRLITKSRIFPSFHPTFTATCEFGYQRLRLLCHTHENKGGETIEGLFVIRRCSGEEEEEEAETRGVYKLVV